MNTKGWSQKTKIVMFDHYDFSLGKKINAEYNGFYYPHLSQTPIKTVLNPVFISEIEPIEETYLRRKRLENNNAIRSAIIHLFDKPIPIIEPLKLKQFKPRFRANNPTLRNFSFTHNAKTKTRLGKQNDSPIPRIETFNFSKKSLYRLEYYTPIRQTKNERTEHAIRNMIGETIPKHEYNYTKVIWVKDGIRTETDKGLVTPTILLKNGKRTEKRDMILRSIWLFDEKDGIGFKLYSLDMKYEKALKPEIPYAITKTKKQKPKLPKTINYKLLAKYDKRLSRKWFNQLIALFNPDISKTDKRLILRNKIIAKAYKALTAKVIKC